MKNKVRLRWYGDAVPTRDETDIYVELKSRQGFASSKQRRMITISSRHLETEGLRRGIIPGNRLKEVLAEFGYFPETPLVPVILISYRRCRFAELTTGQRVSFDVGIRASVVVPGLGRHERAVHLIGGVIEVKGTQFELPVTLRRLKLLDIDWSRFSKYGACLDAHFSEPGSIGRLWPSGKTGL